MATDPNIILAASAQPVQVAGPLDDYQKLLALKNAQQSNALNAQQLQASQLENQQRQLQMQQTQALNDAYKSAITPAADGSTTIDSDKLTNALAQSGHGSAIPTVMKGVTDYQKSLADLKNAMADLQKKQVDFAGGVGARLQQSNYDPRLFLTLGSHAVADKAVNGAAINPLLQQVQSALQQDPSGASARQIVQKIADQWVAQSPEQQKIIAANTTAGARKLTADTQAGKQAIEAPGQAADALTKQVASASQQLAGAKSQQEYAALLGELPQKIAKLMPAPETWNAQTTPKAVLQAGLTPEQKVTSAQGAQRVAIAQQDANANSTRANVDVQRNAREQQFTAPAGSANLTGDDFLKTLNPRVAAQIKAISEGRMPPPNPGNRSQAAQNLLGLLSQYDPTYNAGRWDLNKSLTSGAANSLGGNIRSINTAIQHMGELNDTVAALHNGDVRALNGLANKLGYEAGSGNGKLPAAELAKTMVRGELAKAATGGQVTVEEQQALGRSLDTAQSSQAVADVAKTAAHLLGGKLGAIKDQYNQVMGSRAPQFNVLSPTSRGTLTRLGVNPDQVERKSQNQQQTIQDLRKKYNY